MKQKDATQWVTIVGIGENGLDGLCSTARASIAAATLVAGGKRHLSLAAGLIKGKTLEWPSPLEDAIPQLLAVRPHSLCVLASGDPFTYGIGTTLLRHIPLEEIMVYPAPSSFTLAAARLGWALQDTITIGLNGRPLERIIPQLQPGAHIIALSTDETTPELLANLLQQRGFGQCQLTILERLGGEHERIRRTIAAEFSLTDIGRLNCIAIEAPIDSTSHALTIPLASGLPDACFDHDGQITKREVRAVTLSALAPRRGELLWDIGLGAGSVAIEWLLRDPTNRAIGFEKDSQRIAHTVHNASKLGVPQLRIIEGEAPSSFSQLSVADAPDAIFIGGGATAPGMLENSWTQLKPGGRIVVNAISLETESLLLNAYRHYGGSLIRIGIERADPVGRMTGWRPAMTVMQWSTTKP